MSLSVRFIHSVDEQGADWDKGWVYQEVWSDLPAIVPRPRPSSPPLPPCIRTGYVLEGRTSFGSLRWRMVKLVAKSF